MSVVKTHYPTYICHNIIKTKIMSGFLESSIGRKVAMGLSAIFLMFFLLMHVSINFISICSEDAFNAASHFMGTNWVIQFVMQPVLILGVVFHFVMGFVLEIRNKKAKGVPYVKNNGAANSSWMSRNMIFSGIVILAFLVLHFIDFWIPEINHKYVAVLPEDPTRYYGELQHKFMSPLRVGFYVLAFVFLALHLLHGVTSAFQSLGSTAWKKNVFKTIGKAYAILIPLGFIIIAVYHYFNH